MATAPSQNLESGTQKDTGSSSNPIATQSPTSTPVPTSAEPSTARERGAGSSTSAVISSTKSVPGAERRLSRQERLDEIFETARKRKLMLDQEYPGVLNDEEDPSSRATSPKTDTGDRKRGPEMDAAREEVRDALESSADEETYVFRRRSGQEGNNGSMMNYQSTAQQSSSQRLGKRGDGRSRPSTTSIRRRGKTHDPSQPLDEEEDEPEGWWTRLLSNYGSLELENKGSVARDHLALERTFLAWLRTSLAFASIGIAITQLFRLNTTSASTGGPDPYKHLRRMGKPLGATFLGISIVMLGVGFHRYFESQHWIIRGKFPASRGSIALVAAITLALSITSLVIIIVVEPGHVERR